jgi:hypothetical protein
MKNDKDKRRLPELKVRWINPAPTLKNIERSNRILAEIYDEIFKEVLKEDKEGKLFGGRFKL